MLPIFEKFMIFCCGGKFLPFFKWPWKDNPHRTCYKRHSLEGFPVQAVSWNSSFEYYFTQFLVPLPVLVMTILICAWRFPLPFMFGDSYFKSQVPCFLESEESVPLTQAGEHREYLALKEKGRENLPNIFSPNKWPLTDYKNRAMIALFL